MVEGLLGFVNVCGSVCDRGNACMYDIEGTYTRVHNNNACKRKLFDMQKAAYKLFP